MRPNEIASSVNFAATLIIALIGYRFASCIKISLSWSFATNITSPLFQISCMITRALQSIPHNLMIRYTLIV